jgi:D-serine deaminase-like pyridoxal phosphate-dependent protein
VRVLAELGYPGGRTGCRDAGQLVAVARSAAAAPGVELAGVAGYEGGIATVSEASRYLSAVRSAVTELADAGLLPEEVIVTAGGSAYFDLVAAELGGNWLPGHQLRIILRSGAYVSHDNGMYQVKTPFTRIPGALEAALEIWAQVTSVPERGLALAGMGKREAPYDAGLPVPLRVRHGAAG